MKTFFMTLTILALFASTNASALPNYLPVPEGFYSGVGEWTDNLGDSGSLTTTVRVYRDSAGDVHDEFTAQFDDGRSYTGSVKVVYTGNSEIAYVIHVDGNDVMVGTGVVTETSYQNTNLKLGADESISEIGHFSAVENLWVRSAVIKNHSTGRTTIMTSMKMFPR